MAGEVIITGLEETMRAIQEMPKLIAARGYLKALSRGIGVVRYALDARTPIRASDLYTAGKKGDRHPGDLKRALTTEINIDSQARGGTAEVGYAGFQGRIANWVEFGHHVVRKGGTYVDKRGRRRKGTVSGFVPAHPFMRPVYDSVADEVVEVVAESLAETVKETYLP